MKTLHHGIVIGMLTALAACSNNDAGSAGTTRVTTVTKPSVAPALVKQVQSKLRDDGYYKGGPVDGVWGSGTQGAVRSFQRDHNLGTSGELDVPTLQALNLTGGSAPATNQTTNNAAPAQPPRTDTVPNTPPPANTTTPTPTPDTTTTAPDTTTTAPAR